VAGKLVATGNLDELQIQYLAHRKIRLTVLGESQAASQTLQSMPQVSEVLILPSSSSVERHSLSFEFLGDDQALSEVLRNLILSGVIVLHFDEDNGDLEDLFLKVTKGLVT
jgi:ABC-2 type transport system ATP-binding protein